jgi:hypothetical protein
MAAIKGEQQEQTKSRQTSSKQGWRNQQQARQHPRTLRKIYVRGFAAGYPETATLNEVLLQPNETSLSQLRRDHETEHLEHKIAHVSE